MTRIEEILDRIGTLPPLPTTALRLMAVINDPRSSMEDIVEVVRYDQSLTTQVLRLCNSAFFGLSRQVSSLSEAMFRLGTLKVLQLVMSVHTNVLLMKEQRGYSLEPGALWRHSVGVALASTVLGERCKIQNISLLFTAGLLHDIGKVILNEYVAQECHEIVRLVHEQQQSFIDAETQVLGHSHDQIGGMVAERWQLPDSIVRCIRYHHTPLLLNPPDPQVDVVFVADCVCLMLGIGVGVDELCYRCDHEVMQRLGLHERDLEFVGSQMLDELAKIEQIFGVRGSVSAGGSSR